NPKTEIAKLDRSNLRSQDFGFEIHGFVQFRVFRFPFFILTTSPWWVPPCSRAAATTHTRRSQSGLPESDSQERASSTVPLRCFASPAACPTSAAPYN